MAINYAVRFLIYSSVSEILGSVLTPGATAHAIWTAVEGLFHDNKASCALALEAEFHSNVFKAVRRGVATDYCLTIKRVRRKARRRLNNLRKI